MSDLISRQALRDAMYHEAFETDTEMQRWDSGCWIRYKLFENVIDNLPSAERKGEWIRNIDSLTGTVQKPYCSVCGKTAIENRGLYCIITNFCPNCGAYMTGGENE